MKSSWMLVAAALFALMGVLVKQASINFSSPELVFYRSAFGLMAIWLGIAWQRRHFFAPLATQHLLTHYGRATLEEVFLDVARGTHSEPAQ